MNYTYLLRCADGSLYCGWTNDLEKRLAAHNAGTGARYTKSRRPCELVWQEAFETKEEAMSREWHVKRLTRAQKEELLQERGRAQLLQPDPEAEGRTAGSTEESGTHAGGQRVPAAGS